VDRKKNSSARTILLTIIVVPALFIVSCASPNFQLTKEETPLCTGEDLRQWSRVVDRSQGVMGQDPVGFYIADYPAEKFGILNINNWLPLSGYKETLCGELHHFNVYDGSGAEMDWNHFIIPSTGFEYLITDALPYKGGSGVWCVNDNWHDCDGTDNCMEGELTPDQTFYENPWFPKSIGDSNLEGREICVYGPWIRECVHGHRPEIHPAELTWWKEKWGDADLYWLMALQDDSNRFDDKNEFDIEGTPPPEWRPWGAAPMSAKFKLAFEVNPAGPGLVYDIGEAFAMNVVTRFDLDASRDSDNGAEHAIEYDDKIVLRANENQPEDIDLGVTFTDICQRTDGFLQGYVNLTTKTGVSNEGEEGYHILFVTVNEVGEVTPPVITPPIKVKAVISSRGDSSSIKPEVIKGKNELLGDLIIGVESLNGATQKDTLVDKVELVTNTERRELVYIPDSKGRGGRVQNLPLLSSARLSFVMHSQETITVFWPGLGFTALIDDQIQASSGAPDSAWGEMLNAAGGKSTGAGQGLKVMRAGQIKLTAVPLSVMLKDGSAASEEGSPFSEKLSEVLERGDESETKRIFGTTQPLRIKWTFKATNMTTGVSVPVEIGKPGASSKYPEPVHVVEVPGRMHHESVEIYFPESQGEIFELQATAKVTDVFGSTSENEHKVWSHFLTVDNREEVEKSLLPAITAAASVPTEELVLGGKLGILPPDDPRLRDPKIRRTMILHNAALQAADDGRINLDELEILIRGAGQNQNK